VHEFMNRGEYSILFDVDTLASGLYFYKLQAGKNIAVKKMLLVKQCHMIPGVYDKVFFLWNYSFLSGE
jgi:hypothetical protein